MRINGERANVCANMSAHNVVKADINEKEKLDVLFGGAAQINVDTAVKYIKSGQKEIDDYVQTSLESALETKQDVIEDLENIRTGANLGLTAVQASDLNISLAQKQDVLVSGVNIKTINNQDLIGFGNISINAGVDSVNGKTGDVVLKTSDLTNDSGYITGSSLATVALSGDYGDLTNTPDLTLKADVNLSNITSKAKNIANWSNNVSNCITEIPHDIKLELNNGTLVLAQGCKFYFADGTVKTTTSTLSVKNTGDAQMFLHIKSDGTGLYAGYMTGGTVSERPSSPIRYASYYNTSTQKCEYYNGSTWSEISLPIAIVTRGTDGFVSIDKIFNGFGYIGSTIFALPGVKGLIPNGRNADGSLKSVEFLTDRVLLSTSPYSYNGFLAINSNNFDASSYLNYSQKDNYYYNNSGGVINRCICGTFEKGVDGVVTSFTPKTAFHALDYNDSPTISGWAMPSSRYVNLTLGASGTTYKAPANGWFAIQKINGVSEGSIQMINQTNGLCSDWSFSGNTNYISKINIPVKKGDVIICTYNLTGATKYFRFIYAEGENV